MAHNHDVYDTGNKFEISGTSRFIKETSATKTVFVKGDHNSEVITFSMPRYIDGHDMMLCNKIRVHYINIETGTNNKSADIYEVTDLKICEDCENEDVLVFTWTVEAPAAKYYGPLSFLVKFECTEGDEITYEWNTAKYVGINVLDGIDNSEEFVDKYSNVLEEWYNELTRGADSIEELNQQALAEIELAKEDAKEDIQGKADATMAEMNQFSSNAYNSFKNDVDEKAAETLESIPEEYADMDANLKDLEKDLFGGNKYIEYQTEDGYYKNAEFGEGSMATYQKASIDVSEMIGVELTIVSTSVDTFIYNGFVNENGTRIGTAWNGAGTFVKTVPDGAKYLKICYLVSTGKTTISYELKGILEDVANIDEKIKANNDDIYKKISSSNVIADKHEALYVSMATDVFWACNSFFKNIIKTTISETKFNEDGSGQYEGVTSWQNNAWFKVSGNAGDDFVTFSEVGNASMSDVQTDTDWHGCVLQDSNGNFHNCLAKRKDNSSLYIYPPLTENLNNVEIGNVMADSLHLTKRGFYAYAYGLYNTNPKHCEKDFYLAKFRPNITENPFVLFGRSASWERSLITKLTTSSQFISTANDYCLQLGGAVNSTQFQNTPFGYTWSQDVSGYDGYFEVFIGGTDANARYNTDILRPSDSTICVEMWLDGVLSQKVEKNTNMVERICLDFSNTKNATVKIYLTGINLVEFTSLMNIGNATWWVNRRYDNESTNLFHYHSVAQVFDSWGVYDDGALGKKLKEYIDTDTNMVSEFANVSVGGTTSLYWKHWYNKKVRQLNASMTIVDFGINDWYSNTDYVSKKVTDPYGNEYFNEHDKDYYVSNMRALIDMISHNNSDVVVCCPALWMLGEIISWHYAVIDSYAKLVN